MVAGADSIDDMAILRHGGMGRLFARIYASSTLGSFLRAFTFGHIRQLDAVAARFLLTLAKLTALFAASPVSGDGDSGTYALVDVDDTVVEVHGHAKQGAGFGYNRIRGLNALLATLTTTDPGSCGSVIVAQRLRKGACNSSRGAKRLVGDAVKTARRLLDRDQLVLVRMDSAFYGRGPVHAALAGGAAVSVTVRMNTQWGERSGSEHVRAIGEIFGVYGQALTEGSLTDGQVLRLPCPSCSRRSAPATVSIWSASRSGWSCRS
jgi:hypothetical protein